MIEILLQAERALSVGLLDRAETLYRQVASADPRNSIAVVGLARVTLDRGNELAALDLARDALTIDPENDAAQRMIARLEEVINYRGVAAEAAMAEIDAVGRATPEPAAKDEAEPAATESEPAAPEAESEAAPDVAAPEAEAGSEPGIAEPGPEAGAATDVAATETDDASEPELAEPDVMVVPGSAPEPQPETRPEPEPVATEPEPPRSRSFLDRLFRRR